MIAYLEPDESLCARLNAGVRIRPSGCWEWTGSCTANGYGQISSGPRHDRKRLLTHRVSWWIHRGPIPGGLELDHLCRNRRCANPDHLEPVTHRENALRGIAGAVNAARHRAVTHCPRGHEYDETNTYTRPNGSRQCRACARVRRRGATR